MAAELCFASAREVARLIRTRVVSAREVMAAFLSRINRHNPTLNAIVSRLPDEECLALADRADQQLARGGPVGPLHGLPIAFKDAEPAVGFPWTRGSLVFRTEYPKADSVLVERLRRAGVLPIGKTNISEFTMGSHTYNRVFGTTVNPWDTTKSAGGSSGGAAAAVAAGLLPIADGSDLGGSLRNPASFTNLVALRPTVGLVPNAPTAFPLLELLAKGPVARSVDDAAFLLAAVAGPDDRDPRSYPADGALFTMPLDRSFRGVRVAWCPDIGGVPLDAEVRAVLERQRATFEQLGCVVDDAVPDLAGADEVFLTLRAWMSAQTLGPILDAHRDLLKPEAIWQIEYGRRVTASALGEAMQQHTALLDRVRQFHERFPFLVCAVSPVPPFDASVTWPREVAGVPMDNYIAWMAAAYRVSLMMGPAMAVPAGFTSDGLPVGLQIVGRIRDDLGVLQLARAFEQATGLGRRRPPLAVD